MTSDTPKPRIIDIALQAGLSTATVDRVLNERPGVKAKTVAKVNEAIRQLNLASPRPQVIPSIAVGMEIDVLIAGRSGFANDLLAKGLNSYAKRSGLLLNFDYSARMNAEALATGLRDCLKRKSAGVVVQAVEHPLVREAIANLSNEGIPVVAILTPLRDSGVIGYVGLDNRAVGRTAGLLMGRFSNVEGSVALFTGGNIYRNHEEREIGFRSVIRDEFRHLKLLPDCLGYDDPDKIYMLTKDILAQEKDLTGLFNVGSGNRGIERALLESGRAKETTYIAVNFTPLTRQALVQGTIDAVLHQNMNYTAKAALRAIIDHSSGRTADFEPTYLEIITRENLKQAKSWGMDFSKS